MIERRLWPDRRRVYGEAVRRGEFLGKHGAAEVVKSVDVLQAFVSSHPFAGNESTRYLSFLGIAFVS